MIHFDCDYMAGALPEIMERLQQTNMDETPGYGNDPYCNHAKQLIREACGTPDTKVYFLVGGTQTNTTIIDGLLQRHEGVMAAETGHINVHESGAIEASGHKVLVLPTENGKVKAEDVENNVTNFYADDTYEHMVAPGALYISYPTEYGTIYSKEELEALSHVCRSHNIPLMVDGARLGYGLASPKSDLTLKDIARLADVFYIGGTKQGALFGEAIVVTNPSILHHFTPLIKQHGGLLAKGRLLGIQFETLFTDNLYMHAAQHANRLALKLKEGFIKAGHRPFIDSYTNQQFFILPNTLIDRLLKVATFEYWGPRGEKESQVRFVCSWATSDEAVTLLLQELNR